MGQTGETETAAVESPAQRGGIANLRTPTSEEAREWGRRGGIASGEARRRKASLRAELEALLTADDCVVAKSIAVAICREAKQGNVGAFKAIAQVLGELKDVVGVEADALPPPIVLAVHDAAYIEAERERQKRELAEVVDAAYTELKPQGTAGGTGAESPQTAETPERGCIAAGNAPRISDDKTPAPSADAPQTPPRADSAQAPETDGERAVGEPPPPPPPRRVPRTPSEAAAMRREREARDRAHPPAGRGRASTVLPAAMTRPRAFNPW